MRIVPGSLIFTLVLTAARAETPANFPVAAMVESRGAAKASTMRTEERKPALARVPKKTKRRSVGGWLARSASFAAEATLFGGAEPLAR